MRSGLFIAGIAKQMAQASRAQTTGHRSSRTVTEDSSRHESMQFAIEKLFMITEALWEILKHHHGYTDEQLVQMIQAIDLQDGKLDGKVAKSTQRLICKQCGKTIIKNKACCLYCGTSVPAQKPFAR